MDQEPDGGAGGAPASIAKACTGVEGLDAVTFGGLPRGRTTLVCGGAGSGKTILGLEFAVHGARRYDEPAAVMLFEESEPEVVANAESLGLGLASLVEQGRLAIDAVHVDRSEIEHAGEFDLSGLFIRLEHAVRSVGARRVVLDTVDSLFTGIGDEGVVRSELLRLFRWAKERGLTTVVTCERGENDFSRHGLEEYVSDCVILLDHRVHEEVSTRRLRVVKYRGSPHGTNEYPFMIGRGGLRLLPITSAVLQHSAPEERQSTGLPELDRMLAGRGLFAGSTLMVSGSAGTGKTSFAAHIVAAGCERGERCLYFSFEESPEQVVRNLRSIGLDLEPYRERGLLRIVSTRPSFYGLEAHLVQMESEVREARPAVVAIDPTTSLVSVAPATEVEGMLLRLVDFLKAQEVTAVLTALVPSPERLPDRMVTGISSLVDVWIQLSDRLEDRARSRHLQIVKSRGMRHELDARPYRLSDDGIQILNAGPPPRLAASSAGLAADAAQHEDDAARPMTEESHGT